jgi:hypothetical protein
VRYYLLPNTVFSTVLVFFAAPTRPVLPAHPARRQQPLARTVSQTTSRTCSVTESHTKSLDARQCYAGPARQAAQLDAANVTSQVDVEPHINLSSPISGARNTMPALPSPPASNTPQGHQKVPSGSRPSTAAGSGSRGYRPQQNGGSNGVKQTRARGGEEAGQRPSSRMAPSARDGGPREKPPSKDGTVQRTAKEVEGLKDFVCKPQVLPSTEGA